MKKVKWYRKGGTIKTIGGRVVFNGCVNEAKRESKQLQLAEDSAIGRGSVRVVNKFPRVMKPEKLKAA
jgi:hypothetical protein